MTIKLYIVRHGHAVMQAATDAERPLSEVGKAEAEKAGELLKGVDPELFIASPYLRAQQTASIIKNAAGIAVEVATEKAITPNGDPVNVVELLEGYNASSIVMVSHNPLVTALVSMLVEGHYQGPYVMGTASVASLDFEVIGLGLGSLNWLKNTN